MQSETRICQNCKKDFIIELDDFGFYEKIKVPPPTFCPECRFQRRLMFRNEYHLYKRKCELCKKTTLSTFSPDKQYIVFLIAGGQINGIHWITEENMILTNLF